MSNAPDTTAADPRDAVFDVSDLQADLGRRTGRSAVTVLIFAALKLVLALGTTAILARLIPPGEQGFFALALPAILIAASLSEFGLAQAIVQRETVSHRLASTLFWINIALGVIFTGVVIGLGAPAASFYGVPQVQPVLLGLAPYVFFMVLTTPYVAILRRQMRIRTIEMASLVATLLTTAVAIAAGLLGAGVWALVLQLVLNPLFTVVYLASAVRWYPSRPRLGDLGDARGALSFGGFLAAERLLGELARNIQLIIIGRFFTEVQAGLFYRSQAFAMMPQRRISAPLSGAFVPALARLQSDGPEFRAMYARQVSRANLITVPIGLVFFLCADGIVLILLGPDWADATEILRWLGVQPMSANLLSSLAWALIASGATKAMFYYRFFSVAVLVTGLLWAAQYGLLPLVMASVLVPVVINAPVMMAVVVRMTHLDWGTLARGVAVELAFIALVLAAGFGLRGWLSLGPIAESTLAGLLVLALTAGRIASNPALRGDVLRVIRAKR